MVTIRQNYRAILRQQFRLRKKFNPRYSLRAFSRFLGLSPHRLSSILSGKYGLSEIAARSLASRLGFTTQQSEYFCNLVESEHARSSINREAASARIKHIRNIQLWPKQVSQLELQNAQEICLWGLADPRVVSKFLARYKLEPHLDPKVGGEAQIGLAVRESLDTESSPHHEFSGVILVADVLSTTGYGIYVFRHLTDSIPLIQSRHQAFERAPHLSGKIQAEFSAKKTNAIVEDETGSSFYECSAVIRRTKRESKATFSLIRNVNLSGDRVGKTRVVGTSRFRDKKYNAKLDVFKIRSDSKMMTFLKKANFRPRSWRIYLSEYKYFPMK